MIQKMHPRGVIWGPFSLSQLEFEKENLLSVLSLYIVVLDLGVWAVETIPQGTRFGPFMGKWTMEPSNPKFAWEVSAY
jgi:hypothetical protein